MPDKPIVLSEVDLFHADETPRLCDLCLLMPAVRSDPVLYDVNGEILCCDECLPEALMLEWG